MRIIILIVFAVLLQGCSLFNFLKPQDDDVNLHPDLPRPIQGLQINWAVIELPNSIYVGTTYDEYLKLLEYQSDLIRYSDQINRTVCFYRQDLEEDFCQIYQKEKEE